jgi:site-specific DNA-methyltransferase (adenine-specific)
VGSEKGRFPTNCITTEPDAFFSKYFNVTPPELCKKASKKDRNSDWQGNEIDLDIRPAGGLRGRVDGSLGKQTFNRNTHPTVKPTDLMAWLVRLVTPPGGVVLDPFAGSGSTCMAARREGFFFIGIERELEYVEIARKRVGEIDTVSG